MSTLSGNYYGGIVKNGLIVLLDAAKKDSYDRLSLNWKDISWNGNNGSLINFGVGVGGNPAIQTIWTSSNGGSILFDGINDEVICPLSTSIQSINTTNQLTLSCFIKINFTSQYRDIVGIKKVSGENPFVFRIHENNQYFFDSDVGGIRRLVVYSGTSNDILNQWVQLTATIGNNIIYIYKNGVQISSLSVSGNIKTLDSNFGSMYDMGYGPYSGNISNIMLYNRALSSTEVLQNYNALKGRFGL